MPAAVYRVLGLLCALVESLPIGTNLGMVHLCWMLVSGQLLGSRGAIMPGLQALGLADPAIRRAWVALGQGSWTSQRLLKTLRLRSGQALGGGGLGGGVLAPPRVRRLPPGRGGSDRVRAAPAAELPDPPL
jgi:hypothetical protein